MVTPVALPVAIVLVHVEETGQLLQQSGKDVPRGIPVRLDLLNGKSTAF
jgi:hypothetical protein